VHGFVRSRLDGTVSPLLRLASLTNDRSRQEDAEESDEDERIPQRIDRELTGKLIRGAWNELRIEAVVHSNIVTQKRQTDIQ
jgi:hypothetical protein